MPSDQHLQEIRESGITIWVTYGEDYWRKLDTNNSYPTDFVQEITDSGFLGCLIPEACGGAGPGLVEACAILEEISRSGTHPSSAHAQMYIMGSVLKHGSDVQKKKYLPAIAKGELRLQSFGSTRSRPSQPT